MEDPKIIAERIIANVEKVIIGKEAEVRQALIALLCQGHVLIEDVPGVGKTILARSLATSTGCSFKRIQFTPDLLPSDVSGVSIYSQKTGDFEFRPGPIVAQVVLADEINRATPKTQSALLEAMEERQVTVDGVTHKMPAPFMVLATQNPIEHEGTYPLPEAQLDRFMLKVHVTYPTRDEEKRILDRFVVPAGIAVRQVVDPEAIVVAAAALADVHMDERLRDYIVHVVYATREPEAYRMAGLKPLIEYGASPRASVFLAQAARAHAFVSGRGFVEPDDVKGVAMDVLRHRIVCSYEAEAEGVSAEDVVTRVLAGVEVP